jgi:hypothetical protein
MLIWREDQRPGVVTRKHDYYHLIRFGFQIFDPSHFSRSVVRLLPCLRSILPTPAAEHSSLREGLDRGRRFIINASSSLLRPIYILDSWLAPTHWIGNRIWFRMDDNWASHHLVIHGVDRELSICIIYFKIEKNTAKVSTQSSQKREKHMEGNHLTTTDRTTK